MIQNRSRRLQPSGDPIDYSQFLTKWAPLLAGGVLAAYGLSRRQKKSGLLFAAAGAAFAYQGATAQNRSKEDFARSSVLINSSPEKIFHFWRNFENLPSFMHHLESVRQLGGNRSEWTAVGPGGKSVKWTAEIIHEREGESIAWRSLPGSDVEVNGTVEFKVAVGNRGTIVDAQVQYSAPAGSGLLKLLGKDPSFLMRQDMRRLKMLLETGEIATTKGQSHGPRSAVAAIASAFDPDKPRPQNVTAKDSFKNSRRIS